MRWTDCRVIAFDTETTGLNPFDGDRIVEFGAVALTIGADGTVASTKAHDWLINPEMPIPRASSNITGIRDEDVKGKPTFAKVADRIVELLRGSVVVAHNIAFDINFVRAELAQVGKHWPATLAEVDTLLLSQRLEPDYKSHKLSEVAKQLSVPLDQAHRATDDAEACGRVMVELARRHHADADLDGFIEWADAVGPPPDTGHLAVGAAGVAEFRFGPHQGQLVERHPDYLQWMTIAVERREGQWHPRFPESVRRWARRWLRVRGAGRMRMGGRSQDWELDPPQWLRMGGRS